VVDAVSLDARERIQQALAVYEDYDGDLDGAGLRMPPARTRTKRESGP
jgi:hypothetical protein